MMRFLLELALRAALIALGTAAVLKLLRIRTAAVRHAAWTAVVVVMLILPLWQAGGVRVTLPVLTPAVTNVASDADRTLTHTAPPPVSRSETPAPASMRLPDSPVDVSFDWQSTLATFYVAGVVVLLLRLILGTVEANRLRRSAVLKNGRPTSPRCATPITIGWFRPSLILPEGWERWPAAKLAAVLTHESSHARRRDPLVQWVALFNRAVFWFHPLAWWLERRLSTLSEEASDAAVLAAGHSPQDYSEYLLDMARSVSTGGGRLHVGMAMPGSGLSWRMQQIFRGLPSPRLSRTRVATTVACCAMTAVLCASGTLAERTPAISQAQQTAPPMKITFDVISIKPCLPDPNAGGRGGNSPRFSISPGWVRWGCVTLGQLIENAWGGGSFPNNALLNTILVAPGRRPDAPKRIRGGPSWIDEERYAIEIKISGDTTDLTGSERHDQVNAVIGAQLRAMIEDRFQLKLRKATEERPMYALTVASGGLKMTPTAPSRCWVRSRFTPPDQATPPPGFEGTLPCDHGIHSGRLRGNMSSEFTNISLPDLAKHLATNMDRYVLDRTGVEGRFTFNLVYAPDDRTPGDLQWIQDSATRFAGLRAQQGLPAAPAREPVTPDGPTIFKALEALGLKLEPTRGPAEYLLIESVQRPRPNTPTPSGY